MEEKIRKLNLLISPTNECNMNCIYCYNKSSKKTFPAMDIKTLRKIYDIITADYDYVNIIWHGGEPMIMGVDFYEKALSLQKEYTNTKFRNSMQSNLSLLTDDMIDFLARNKISLGSSFDGLQNNVTRGNTETILKNQKKLFNRGISCGFIFVVSSININYLIENYNFFKENNANFTMNFYIPTAQENNELLELEPVTTIANLSKLYDYWLHDTFCNIRVNYFERILEFILCGKKRVCKYTSCLGKWIGIRGDGQIYPCNRWFPLDYSYGNVFQYEHITEAFKSKGFSKILSGAIKRREKCKECDMIYLCEGGCNQLAISEGDISQHERKSCIILRGIFNHILNSIKNFKYHQHLHLEYNPYFLKYYFAGMQRQFKNAV